MASIPTTSLETFRKHVYSPLAVINGLYGEHKSDKDEISGHDNEFGKAVKNHFKSVFSSPEALERIPVFDRSGHSTRHKNGTLVRFRCMVQDPSYGEELHLSVAHLVNSETGEVKQKFSQYTDADHVLDEGWEVDYSSSNNVFTEKEVAYCVSVPGQSEWAQLGTAVAPLESAFESMSVSSEPKITDASVDISAAIQAKYPLRSMKHSAALVKFYSPNTAPKVLSVIDVVGIYELGYNPKEQNDDSSQGTWPCIHSIYHTSVSLDCLVPGLPKPAAADYTSRRSMCLAHLASVLGGDELAAQYLLLHLLSKTVAVQDAKVGKFSLNLIGFPNSDKDQMHPATFSLGNPSTQWVASALSQLVPRSVEIPFDLKLLNNSSFAPNAELGDLQAGVLQLPFDTQLVCDETCLHEGTLDERGVRNLQALQTAILDQTVTYTYPYQPIDMPSNLRVLILSTGKSILQNDCGLYLSSPAIQFLSTIKGNDTPELKPLDPMHTEQLRQYLEYVRHMEFNVPQDVSDAISSEYAELRREAHKSGGKMMTQAELALTVTVARLLSISKGESELSLDSWKEACSLERSRAERDDKNKATNKK